MHNLAEIIPALTVKGYDWKDNNSHKDNNYSSDQLINAYICGKVAQKNADIQLKVNQLKDNLNKVSSIISEILQEIQNLGFRSNVGYLKIKCIYNFHVLFTINENDYYNDTFLNVYEKSITLKTKYNTEPTFNFSTLFTPFTDDFDETLVEGDGFTIKYED
jgi:hypothetical protein